MRCQTLVDAGKWQANGNPWACETFHTGLKRTVGLPLTARTEATIHHEAVLMLLNYALRV